MHRLAATTLLVAALTAGADAGTGWLSISDLDFSKCQAGDPHQSFEVEHVNGIGKIRDKATGRCLGLKTCTGPDADLSTCSSTCEIAGDHRVVVLDACSDSADGCGGKSQLWTTKSEQGQLQFNSGLNKEGAGMCLNAAGDPTAVNGFSLIVWGCGGIGGPNNNQWFHYDAGSGTITTDLPGKAADGCTGVSCCLTGKPCVAPCSLPMAWGGYVIIVCCSLIGSYLLISMVYMGHTGRLDLNALKTWTPHSHQIGQVAGLVQDGVMFTAGGFQLQRGQSKSATAAAAAAKAAAEQSLLSETNAEKAARLNREAAAAALTAKQKPARLGGKRTALHEAAMVGNTVRLPPACFKSSVARLYTH